MKYYIIYGWSDCSFCARAQKLLERKEIKYFFLSLDDKANLLNHFKEFYNWPTVPIIVEHNTELTDTTLVGGYTELCKHLEVQ